MKLSFQTIVIILSIFIGSNVRAESNLLHSQDYKNYQSVIKLEIALGGLQYEYKINEMSSLSLALQLSPITTSNEIDFQITPEYKYYLSRKHECPRGFYIGSYLFYKDYVVARDNAKDLVKTAGLGIMSGYQWIIFKRFTFSYELGLGYNVYRDVTHETNKILIDESTHYLNFSGGMSIGFMF